MDVTSGLKSERWEHIVDEQKGEVAGLRSRVEDLEQRLSVLEDRSQERLLEDDNPLILCLIDGDGCIFTQELLQLGSTGGQRAAKSLKEGITSYLVDNDLAELSRRGRIWLTIYFNKKGLLKTLKRANICSDQNFEEFITAFHQASPLFSVVDVGMAKEAADVKIKECLRVFTRFPQTSRVFFGGGHDNGYSSDLHNLYHEDLLKKIVFLYGYTGLAAELRSFGVPQLQLKDVFMVEKLPTFSTPWSSPIPAQGWVTPESFKALPTSRISSPALSQGNRQTFILIHLRRFKPLPCANKYLTGKCHRDETCHFNHEYILSPKESAELQEYARIVLPCPTVNINKICSDRDCCIWAHLCPNGSECTRNMGGKCNFRGRAMHNPPNVTGGLNLISSDASIPDSLAPLGSQSTTSSPKLPPAPFTT